MAIMNSPTRKASESPGSTAVKVSSSPAVGPGDTDAGTRLDIEMLNGRIQLLTTPAYKAIRRLNGNFQLRVKGVTRFRFDVTVYTNPAGSDEALGLFPAFAIAPGYDQLVQALLRQDGRL